MKYVHKMRYVHKMKEKGSILYIFYNNDDIRACPIFFFFI